MFERKCGESRDTTFQGKVQRNFHYSQISRHFPLVPLVKVCLIKSNAVGNEEGEVSGMDFVMRRGKKLDSERILAGPSTDAVLSRYGALFGFLTRL
jgi:hypothetical protein